jgi:hypothetical protein
MRPIGSYGLGSSFALDICAHELAEPFRGFVMT